MKRRRTTLLEVVDRVVVILVGLALVAAGAAILAIALDLLVPPDVAGIAENAMAELEAWPDAAVIVVATIVAILGAAFSIRHLLPARQQQSVNKLRLPSGEGRHRTELRGRALSKVLEADLGRLPSVSSSSARLVSADPPAFDAKVTTTLWCDLDELNEHIAEVAERLEGSLGRSVRVRIQIGFGGASANRVE